MYLGDYNNAEAAHRQALAIAEKLNWKEEIAESLFHLGIVNRLRGNSENLPVRDRSAAHQRHVFFAEQFAACAQLRESGARSPSSVLFAAESKKLYDALLRPTAAQLAGKTDLISFPTTGFGN